MRRALVVAFKTCFRKGISFIYRVIIVLLSHTHCLCDFERKSVGKGSKIRRETLWADKEILVNVLYVVLHKQLGRRLKICHLYGNLIDYCYTQFRDGHVIREKGQWPCYTILYLMGDKLLVIVWDGFSDHLNMFKNVTLLEGRYKLTFNDDNNDARSNKNKFVYSKITFTKIFTPVYPTSLF